MNIDYPSAAERNAAIQDLLDRVYPEESLKSYLTGLYRHLGFSFIFHGMDKMVAFIVVLYIACIFCTDMTTSIETTKLWFYVVMFSPLAFQLPMLIAIIGEEEQNMMELQMTCRFTAYHVLTLRMILAAAFAMAANGLLLAMIFADESLAELAHIIFLSITVVLTYTTLYLLLLWKRNPIVSQLLLAVSWTGVQFVLWSAMPTIYGYLAMHLPLIYHIAVWVVMGTIATKQLQKGLRYHYAALV